MARGAGARGAGKPSVGSRGKRKPAPDAGERRGDQGSKRSAGASRGSSHDRQAPSSKRRRGARKQPQQQEEAPAARGRRKGNGRKQRQAAAKAQQAAREREMEEESEEDPEDEDSDEDSDEDCQWWGEDDEEEDSEEESSDDETAEAQSHRQCSSGGDSEGDRVYRELLRRGAEPAVVGKRKPQDANGKANADCEVEMELFTQGAAKKARLVPDDSRFQRSSAPSFRSSGLGGLFGF
mmetsp:Transcript_42671/g.68948  ORF Transcript_42671/g.68948 Transcript_42671/m.68948 type:complete len:237 (+) Transcript_42671:41-751(+)